MGNVDSVPNNDSNLHCDSILHCDNIEKLNSENYNLWQHKVKMLLIEKNLWTVVNEESQEDPKWKKMNEKALAIINYLVEDGQLRHIMNITSAKNAWKTLRKHNEKSSYATLIYLKRNLLRLKLSDGGDMEHHLKMFMAIVDKISAVGQNFSDNDLALILLCSLPDSYNNLVSMLDFQPEEGSIFNLVRINLLEKYRKKRNLNNTVPINKTLNFTK